MTIKRMRPTLTGDVDDYGNPEDEMPAGVELVGAFTAPRMSEGLEADGRSGVIVGLTLFLPYGSDLMYSDRVDIDGVVYEIDGEPGRWKHPTTGWEAGMTVALVRGEG